MAETRAPETVDEYIAGFPREVQAILKQVRRTVKAAAPEALEKISYRVPTFTLDGVLVHYAAFKNHRESADLGGGILRAAGSVVLSRAPRDLQFVPGMQE